MEELQKVSDEKDDYAQRCHDLDLQVRYNYIVGCDYQNPYHKTVKTLLLLLISCVILLILQPFFFYC